MFFSSVSKMLLLFLKLISVIIILVSSNMMTVWLGLELGLYSTMGLLVYDSYKAAFFYWVLKVMGSFLFVSGLVIKSLYIIWVGMFLKISYFPLIIWIPKMICSLSFTSLFVLLMMKKIPSFVVFKKISLNDNMNFIVGLLIFVLSNLMLLFQSKMKVLLAWSSNIQVSCLFILINQSLKIFFFFFSLYSILLTLLLVLLYKPSKKTKGSMVSILVMLSGLPPFVVFFYKMQFFLVLVETISLVGLLIFSLGYVLSFYGYFRHVFNYVFSANKLDLKKFWGLLLFLTGFNMIFFWYIFF